MKKLSILIMVVLSSISLALSGCSKSSSPSESASKDYRIGVLQLMEHPALDDARIGLEDGLKELGLDVEIIYQNAQGDLNNSISIAQRFANDKVDLIYAIATPAAQAAKQVTSDIPILFNAVTDPISAELLSSWDSPEANITGISDKTNTLEQLKMFNKIDPSIKKIGIIYNTSESNSYYQVQEVERLGPDLGLEIVTLGITNINELAQGMDSIVNRVDAMYFVSDNLIASSVEMVANKLIEKQMISVCAEESQVNGGLLITNGPSYYELGLQASSMAYSILEDKEAIVNLGVELGEKPEVKVNANTIKALGLNPENPLFQEAITLGN